MLSIDQARSLYDGAEAAHAFDHVLRVLALAERIAQAEGADLVIVRTATLLHDMARHEPEHHLRGAERARELLAGWPPEQVEAFRAEMDHAKADYMLVSYPGVKHTFTNREADSYGAQFGLPLKYDVEADRDSWTRSLELLKAVLH